MRSPGVAALLGILFGPFAFLYSRDHLAFWVALVTAVAGAALIRLVVGSMVAVPWWAFLLGWAVVHAICAMGAHGSVEEAGRARAVDAWAS